MNLGVRARIRWMSHMIMTSILSEPSESSLSPCRSSSGCTRFWRVKGRTNADQQAVLIDIVEPVESPECVIPALVWLDGVDCPYGVWPHALNLAGLPALILRRTVCNGEIRSGGRRVASNQNQLIGEMI